MSEKLNTLVIEIEGEKTTLLLQDKVFKSGKTGYFVCDKIKDSAGTRFQLICNVVKLEKKK